MRLLLFRLLGTVHKHDGNTVFNGIAVLAGGAFNGVVFLANRGAASRADQDVEQFWIHEVSFFIGRGNIYGALGRDKSRPYMFSISFLRSK